MPTPLWEPPDALVERATMTRFMREHGHDSYADLWQWSVDDLEGFWGAVWDFFEVGERTGPVLASHDMPGATWFPEVELNYAERVFRPREDEDAVAIVHASELRELDSWSWA